MPKTASWSTKRSAAKSASANEKLPGKSSFKERDRAGSLTYRSASSGRFAAKSRVAGELTLPNGDRISTVRKDVMDSALGRDKPTKRR
jgi:hypothetical protein